MNKVEIDCSNSEAEIMDAKFFTVDIPDIAMKLYNVILKEDVPIMKLDEIIEEFKRIVYFKTLIK